MIKTKYYDISKILSSDACYHVIISERYHGKNTILKDKEMKKGKNYKWKNI